MSQNATMRLLYKVKRHPTVEICVDKTDLDILGDSRGIKLCIAAVLQVLQVLC